MPKPKVSFSIPQILTLLAEAPKQIAALTTDLASAALQRSPEPGEWSANDVLAHLRSCADVWGKCISTMLAQDKPTMKAIDPRTWIKQTDYPRLEFHVSLQAYTTQRSELMAVLESLTPEAWARAAIMTGAGRPIERSVQSFARRMAQHERPHIKQIKYIVDALRG